MCIFVPCMSAPACPRTALLLTSAGASPPLLQLLFALVVGFKFICTSLGFLHICFGHPRSPWIKAAKTISSCFCCHTTPTLAASFILPHQIQAPGFEKVTWECPCVRHCIDLLHLCSSHGAKCLLGSSSQMPACFPGCRVVPFCIKYLLSLQECFCGALQKLNNIVVI